MRLWDRGFTENFVRFLRTPCFIEQLCGCFWKYVSEGMHRLLIPLRKGLLINKQNQRLDNSKQWWNRKFSKIIFGKVLKQPPAVFSKKRMFLKEPVLESLFNKVAGLQIFKNTYLEEPLRTTASKSHKFLFELFHFLKTENNCLVYFVFNSFMTVVFIIKKQSTDLLCKSMDWFLYYRDLRHERVKKKGKIRR